MLLQCFIHLILLKLVKLQLMGSLWIDYFRNQEKGKRTARAFELSSNSYFLALRLLLRLIEERAMAIWFS